MVPGDELINIFYRVDLFLEYPIVINAPYTSRHYNLRLNAFLMQIHCLYRVITELKRLTFNNSSFFQNLVFVLFFFQPQNKGKKKNTKDRYNGIALQLNCLEAKCKAYKSGFTLFFYFEKMESTHT